MIRITCPGCGHGIKAPEAMAGTNHNCPGCGAPITIEDPLNPLPDPDCAPSSQKRYALKASEIVVTTGDLRQPYEVIGPVYFQVSNKGVFSNQLTKLKQQYEAELEQQKASGLVGGPAFDWGFLYGEWTVGQSDFEAAFFVAMQELRKRAELLKGDAIIGMRQDIDLDTNGFAHFYLQAYGTVVRYVLVTPETDSRVS